MLGLVCFVVSHGWAEYEYVQEDATVEALKEIEYKDSPCVHRLWPSGGLWTGADQYA